jgi:hypothetical protein
MDRELFDCTSIRRIPQGRESVAHSALTDRILAKNGIFAMKGEPNVGEKEWVKKSHYSQMKTWKNYVKMFQKKDYFVYSVENLSNGDGVKNTYVGILNVIHISRLQRNGKARDR